MTKQKFRLAFITNEAKRKSTFKKRANGFLNKVSELSTLCGVHACAIVYGPYDTKPMLWPNNLGVQRVISLFENMPEMEKSKQMFNQETFLRQRLAKVNEQLRKKKTANRGKEITELMFECLLIGKGRLQNLSRSDLHDLGCKIDQKLTEVNKRMEDLRKTTTLQQGSAPPLQPLVPQTPTLVAPDEVGPLPPTTLAQPLMPVALQEGAPPPPLEPPMTIDQMQPNIMHVQEHNQILQGFGNWADQRMEDIVYGQAGENQIIMPLTNNSSIASAWPNSSYDARSDHLASNPYGVFFNLS